MTTKPKIIARETAESSVAPTEIWCESSTDGSVLVRARNEGVDGGYNWTLLLIGPNSGVRFVVGVPSELGLPLDDKGRLKIAE